MAKGKPNNLIGREFGRLRVEAQLDPDWSWNRRWLCYCAPDLGGCGQRTSAAGRNLISGNTISCGCVRRESTSRTGRRRFTKTCVTCGREYAGANRQKYCGRACRPRQH